MCNEPANDIQNDTENLTSELGTNDNDDIMYVVNDDVTIIICRCETWWNRQMENKTFEFSVNMIF